MSSSDSSYFSPPLLPLPLSRPYFSNDSAFPVALGIGADHYLTPYLPYSVRYP